MATTLPRLDRYMLAIEPPEWLANYVREIQIELSKKYGCYKALWPPVHMTLFEPIKLHVSVEKSITLIEEWVAAQTPFEITMNNYNFFKKEIEPVVFIDVAPNSELKAFRKELVYKLRTRVGFPATRLSFTPHFTIGYKDVPLSVFQEIVNEYSNKEFHASFTCDKIYFWKHEGGNWKAQNIFELRSLRNIEKVYQAALF